jgi:hypothetical protein
MNVAHLTWLMARNTFQFTPAIDPVKWSSIQFNYCHLTIV